MSYIFGNSQTVLIICNGANIQCSNADKFLYTVPGTNCTKYYRCPRPTNPEPEILECEPNSVFMFDIQTCTRSVLGKCYEPDCKDRLNGIYQDTTHACMRFFRCYAGKIISIENCPPKQLYNGQRCVPQESVICNAPKTVTINYLVSKNDQRCADRTNGHYSVDDDCSKFIICFAGEVFAINSCPSGQLFHFQLRKCLPQNSVRNCQNHEMNTSFNHSIDSEFDHICQIKRDGATPDPSSRDCSTYIICRGGKFQSQNRCAYQAVFNGLNCVPSPLYECPLQSMSDQKASIIDPCFKKKNGFHPNPENGCTFYMLCMYGRIASIGECPKGFYFDAESRTCIFESALGRRRCIQRGISSDCNDKSIGFYRGHNCHSYYHCYAGYKTEFKCSSSKVFNGERCATKTQYNCPSGDLDTFCANRPDGYHKDYNDGCRSYHYCSKGNKITYLCEEGHTFDIKTKKCVPQQLIEISGSSGQRCRADYMCYGKSDGYHADYRSNCRKYVYCKNFDKITQLTCRDNNVFNGQKCVPPTEYACPSLYNHKQLNCIPRHCMKQCENDGFYPDLHSDCRNYFFCIDGKASKLSCPPGRRFNGEICVPEDSFNCPEICNGNDSNELSSCPSGIFVT